MIPAVAPAVLGGVLGPDLNRINWMAFAGVVMTPIVVVAAVALILRTRRP